MAGWGFLKLVGRISVRFFREGDLEDGGGGFGEEGVTVVSREKEGLSGGVGAVRADEVALGDGDEGKGLGVWVFDFLAGLEVVEGGAEKRAACEGVAVGLVHLWFDVVEIDGGEGLGDVEFAGLAGGGVFAVPVEDAVGGVGVLLDFVDQESAADGVEASGRDEDGLSFVRGDAVDVFGDGAVFDGALELRFGGVFFEADVEFGAGQAVGDEPHFGFRLAAEGGGEFGWRVNLNGKVVGAVEDFDEDGEACGVGEVFAEDFFATVVPEVVEVGAAERAVVDDGLRLGSIDDFPCLAVGGGGIGEGATVVGFERAPAPNPGHVDGGEGEHWHGLRMGDVREILKWQIWNSIPLGCGGRVGA